jgi:hypothetical protein
MVPKEWGLELAARFGNPQPINREWLDQEEQRAQGAKAVALPGDQYIELLALANNGLHFSSEREAQ